MFARVGANLSGVRAVTCSRFTTSSCRFYTHDVRGVQERYFGMRVSSFILLCCHSTQHENRDWDLWGPLILCLLLGIMLSVNVCLYHACVKPWPTYLSSCAGACRSSVRCLHFCHSHHLRWLSSCNRASKGTLDTFVLIESSLTGFL